MKITIELTHDIHIDTKEVNGVWVDVNIKELPMMFFNGHNELVSQILDAYRATAVSLMQMHKNTPNDQPAL